MTSNPRWLLAALAIPLALFGCSKSSTAPPGSQTAQVRLLHTIPDLTSGGVEYNVDVNWKGAKVISGVQYNGTSVYTTLASATSDLAMVKASDGSPIAKDSGVALAADAHYTAIAMGLLHSPVSQTNAQFLLVQDAIPGTSSTTVRVANASPDSMAFPVDVLLDDALIGSNLNFGGVTTATTTTAQAHLLTLKKGSRVVYGPVALDLTMGGHFTVVAYGIINPAYDPAHTHPFTVRVLLDGANQTWIAPTASLVRVANAAVDGPIQLGHSDSGSVGISPVFASVAYDSLTSYGPGPAGAQVWSLIQPTDPTVKAADTMSVAAGDRLTFVAMGLIHGGPYAPALIYAPPPVSTPPSGQGNVRFIMATPDFGGAVTITANDGTAPAEWYNGVAYQAITSWQTVSARTYTFSFQGPTGAPIVLTGVTVDANKSTTFLVMGYSQTPFSTTLPVHVKKWAD